jgi:hypothetical protein
MKTLLLLLLSTGCWAADLDIFLVGGQSNAVGYGDSTKSPKVFPGQCLAYHQGVIKDANDPVGNAFTGSAWPSFCRAYHSLTRRAVMVVPAAVGGSAQCAQADAGYGNWDAAGTLTNRALGLLTEALDAAQAAGWTTHYRGMIWNQGETDGDAMNFSKITIEQYRTALLSMWRRMRAARPGSALFIIRLGSEAVGMTPASWDKIRQGQEDVASYFGVSDDIHVVFRGCAYFSAYGLSNPKSTAIHYNQLGYNLMGRYAAIYIATDGMLVDSMLIEGVYPNAVRTQVFTN